MDVSAGTGLQLVCLRYRVDHYCCWLLWAVHPDCLPVGACASESLSMVTSARPTLASSDDTPSALLLYWDEWQLLRWAMCQCKI